AAWGAVRSKGVGRGADRYTRSLGAQRESPARGDARPCLITVKGTRDLDKPRQTRKIFEGSHDFRKKTRGQSAQRGTKYRTEIGSRQETCEPERIEPRACDLFAPRSCGPG